ncbi:hypothetical protein KA107_01125 [Candidatus Pacearchaeota archaeon]|nr:hypothetical protein [Candidatus Pacearchaeota archaeon]
MDIFDNTILCKKCNRAMKPQLVSKNGFNLRTIKCEKCGEIIVHPSDKQEYEEFIKLKQKEYEVKMRMVGNSYAVSIPREIVDFMREQENMINDMVKLSFQEAGRISLSFNTPEQENSRSISTKEVRIVRNGKVFHAKQVSDSANPKNNKKVILRNELNEEEEETEDGR